MKRSGVRRAGVAPSRPRPAPVGRQQTARAAAARGGGASAGGGGPQSVAGGGRGRLSKAVTVWGTGLRRVCRRRRRCLDPTGELSDGEPRHDGAFSAAMRPRRLRCRLAGLVMAEEALTGRFWTG